MPEVEPTGGRLMVLDTPSLYFRAFFGVPDSITAPDGTPVNAVRGLLDFIARLVTDRTPTHLVACMDRDWRPAFRVEAIPSYKAHRVASGDEEQVPDPLIPQVAIIEDVLAALGVPVLGAEGYEADDVIGTLATASARPVDVVTGDRDLFQLVDDARRVRVLYTARGVGRHEVVDERAIVGRYGVLPQQYADFAVLRGDASDGLPGVKGIGAKTAAGLLQQYGDLPSILEAAIDPASGLSSGLRGKLRSAADYLAVASPVVEVARDIDLPMVSAELQPLTAAQAKRARELGERWGLGSALTRALAALPQS